MIVALAACGDNAAKEGPPTIAALALTTAEDTPVTATVDAHDARGAALAIELGTPKHGTVAHVNSVVTYTPEANYNGSDSISVHVSDGAQTADATIDITITAVNDPPVAGDVMLAAAEDTPLVTAQSTLIAAASDVDADHLTISEVSSAVHGTVAITGSDVTFTPEHNFNGAASYQFAVSDGTAVSTATVSITVGGVNDPPVAVDDTLTTPEEVPLVVAGTVLTANDTDAESQTLTVTAVANPTHGTVALDAGTVTFTPDANFDGAAGFDYTVSDGAATGGGHVTVTVTDVNDAPLAVDDALNGTEDTVQTIPGATLTANDTDIDSTILTVTAVGNAAHCTVSVSDGNVTFTPEPNFNGAATFEYTVSDGTLTDIGLVTVSVAAVDDAPSAVADALIGSEDTAQTILGTALTANDTDIEGDALTVTAVGNATHCTVTVTGGDVSFTPDPDFAGDATFEYTVSDGTLTAVGRVTVAVAPVDDGPVAVDDLATTEANLELPIATATLVANDIDIDGPALSVAAVQNPQHGTAVLVGTTITFTPEADFIGDATFEYVVTDGLLTDVGQVTVAVVNASVCGDGVITGIEKCDDGNANPGDGCSATCRIELGFRCTGQPSVCTTVCGDGFLAGGEQCDDGNTIPGDGCDATCHLEICGDGLVNNRGAEACDDGNTTPGDGCNATCQVEPGFRCTGEPSTCTTVCGDHIIAGGETCDDGNTTPGDGCNATCHIETCGDGVVNNSGSEDCDDGNLDETDGCTTKCVRSVVCNATAQPGGSRFVVDPDTGHCYVSFDNDPTPFAAGEAACVAIGGHLATVTSAGEEAFVDAAQGPNQTPWLGASDDANTTDRVFTWVTHEPWDFTHFAAGEPDDDGAGGGGDCIHIANAAGEWADTNCTTSTEVTGRICELDPVPCGDGVTQTVNGETCDDGNTIGGDGCSAICHIEVGANVTFSFTGAVGSETTFPADAVTTPGLALRPEMSRGPGATAAAAGNAFSGTSWNTAALDPTAYYSFTITPSSTTALTLLNLALDDQKSGTGPTTAVIRSSLDGFTADLVTFTTHTAIATGHTTLPLGAAFANLTAPVELRIFGFGATAAGGTWRIDNVALTAFTSGL